MFLFLLVLLLFILSIIYVAWEIIHAPVMPPSERDDKPPRIKPH